jgi:hypothetical protein
MAEGRPPPAMWVRRRQTNGMGLRLALPSIDWWWRFGRGGHRRVAAAQQRRRDRRSSDDGEDRGSARECVALVAPRCPREGARWVAGLGEPAEERAWLWLPGSGRGSADSGEQAVRLGHWTGAQISCSYHMRNPLNHMVIPQRRSNSRE